MRRIVAMRGNVDIDFVASTDLRGGTSAPKVLLAGAPMASKPCHAPQAFERAQYNMTLVGHD
jgi:hypothetical protein